MWELETWRGGILLLPRQERRLGLELGSEVGPGYRLREGRTVEGLQSSPSRRRTCHQGFTTVVGEGRRRRGGTGRERHYRWGRRRVVPGESEREDIRNLFSVSTLRRSV